MVDVNKNQHAGKTASMFLQTNLWFFLHPDGYVFHAIVTGCRWNSHFKQSKWKNN